MDAQLYVMKISSVNGFKFCPYCGQKVEKEEQPIGRNKTNLEITCPEHGVLIIGRA